MLVNREWLNRSAQSYHPIKNNLLRRLDRADLALVQPHLIAFPLERGGGEAFGADDESMVLFPESGLLSLLLDAGGESCPIAMLGHDGMTNHHLVFPEPKPSYRVSVQIQGFAWAMTATTLRRLVATIPALRSAYLSFVAGLQLQVAGTLRSSMNDAVHQRLARLLLMCRDRIDGDRIYLFHSDLGELLRVRRASVTDALHRLESRSAITNTRGLIGIRSRSALTEIAGASYGIAERATVFEEMTPH